MSAPAVHALYEPRICSVQYVVVDPATRRCAIVDPVLDYDEKSGSTATRLADELLAFVDGKNLELEWILDTHPHANHLSAAATCATAPGSRQPPAALKRPTMMPSNRPRIPPSLMAGRSRPMPVLPRGQGDDVGHD